MRLLHEKFFLHYFFYTMKRKAAAIDSTPFHLENQQNHIQNHIQNLDVELNSDQSAALKRVLETQDNVFITGEAGTGKTLWIKHVIEGLSNGPYRREFEVTAMTGFAAQPIRGRTLQNWLGCGLFQGSAMYLAGHINSKPSLKQRWTKIKTLILDEAGMCKPDLFQRMDEVGRLVRKSPLPFGGIQLIICADFLQLPPIYTDAEPMQDNIKYIFQLTHLFPPPSNTYVFTNIFRQTHSQWKGILSRCRKGQLTEEDHAILQTRIDVPIPTDGIEPTHLMPRRADVHRINMEKLCSLEPDKHKWMVYDAETVIAVKDPQLQTMAKDLIKAYQSHRISPSKLQLAVGAQVLLTKNIAVKDGFSNGTAGRVIAFKKDSTGEAKYPEVLFSNGKTRLIVPSVTDIQYKNIVYGQDIQVPLQLGWALTIHRAQGTELDKIILSLNNQIRTPGQAYVAMSRVKTMDGLILLEYDADAIEADPIVVEFENRLKTNMASRVSESGVKKETKKKCEWTDRKVVKETKDIQEKDKTRETQKTRVLTTPSASTSPKILKGPLRDVLKQAELLVTRSHGSHGTGTSP
jgi:ATP-dependent DNA helicase PIF1